MKQIRQKLASSHFHTSNDGPCLLSALHLLTVQDTLDYWINFASLSGAHNMDDITNQGALVLSSDRKF